ncbi:MAG: SsrA-binding protein SmpB [Kiritimatiellaeota bacterium]|nr:SsrA-binding protein SmpB [Kiritimatiellota bacterium]
MSAKAKPGLLVKNRKAFHEYAILESFEAGLELRGTEVKSCREKNITIADSYVRFDNGEAWLLNVNISPYTHGNQFNHDPKRERRLLLHKREIRKLTQLVKEKGLTVIPLDFHLTRGRVKVSIGVGKGKTQSDKRETLRKRQDDLDARRAMGRG